MPYKSLKQAAFFNANRSKLEKEGVNVDDWNAASKGMNLPERALAAKPALHQALQRRKKRM